MKAAIILPQAFLRFGAYNDYHMALAHLIGKDGFVEYTQYYQSVGQDPNQFLMLDTGLIEGDPRPVEELIEKAKFISADEMALNDVFMDREGTLIETYDALNKVKANGINIRTMGIPQGNCLADWVKGAREMIKWEGINTIGVPKVLVHLEGMFGRLRALTEVGEEIQAAGKEIHLLGCWESPLELSVIEAAIHTGSCVPVRGVDSAIAYAYAREGIRITDDERPEGAINFAATECDLDVLQYNIDVYIKEAQSKRVRHGYGSNIIELL